MERVRSRSGSVEILAQLDRAPGHDASRGAWQSARRYQGSWARLRAGGECGSAGVAAA